MKKAIYLLAIMLVSSFSYAQFPSSVKRINAQPNKTTTVIGNLAFGKVISNLRWASYSSNACFPATQNKKFNGNHVLYSVDLPPYSEMFITLIPTDRNANMSIYAYSIGKTNYSIPPALASCISCEAEHKWDYKKRGKTQDHTRTVRLNATKYGYNVVIGAVGANGLKKGAFKIKIELKTRVENNASQKPLKKYTAKSVKGKTKIYSGNLSDGVKIHDLSWASSSSNACFPATQNKKFNGNHVIYLTELPKYSEMFITVIPEDKNANMSIYAYSTGSYSNMVPKLASCVSCEAEHKWDYKKRGKTQDHTRTVRLNATNNPYKVVIGVVGANGLTKGKFNLKIEVK